MKQSFLQTWLFKKDPPKRVKIDETSNIERDLSHTSDRFSKKESASPTLPIEKTKTDITPQAPKPTSKVSFEHFLFSPSGDQQRQPLSSASNSPPTPANVLKPSESKWKNFFASSESTDVPPPQKQCQSTQRNTNKTDADSASSGLDVSVPSDSDDDLDDVSGHRGELSAYELKRLATIQHNNEIMSSIGVKAIASEFEHLNRPIKKTKSSKRTKSRRLQPQVDVPRRYSLRTRGMTAIDAPNTDLGQTTETKHEVIEEEQMENFEYDLSHVHQYAISTSEESDFANYRLDSNKDNFKFDFLQNDSASIVAIPSSDGRSQRVFGDDANLSRIYTMDFLSTQKLLAAGGHGGRVVVYGLKAKSATKTSKEENEEEGEKEESPLLSWKAHSGWISGVQFVSDSMEGADDQPNPNQSSPWLLSSSNDGAVTLWDLSKSHSNRPRQVDSTKSLHVSGIFSMHIRGVNVLTGSKDGTVALSHIRPEGKISRQTMFDELHSAVVKTVRWSNEHIFASAGNDKDIYVTDIREKKAVHIICESHATAINSVSWHPTDPNLILSASFDPTVLLHDIRKGSNAKPIVTFQGHHAPQISRCKNIHHPLFLYDGNVVACGGEKTNSITLFRTQTGEQISRGILGYDATSLATTPMIAYTKTTETNRRYPILAVATRRKLCLYSVKRKENQISEQQQQQ